MHQISDKPDDSEARHAFEAMFGAITHHLFKRRQLRTSKISRFVPDQYSKTIHRVVESVAIGVVAHSPAVAPNSPQCLDSEQIHALWNSHPYTGEIIVVAAVGIRT